MFIINLRLLAVGRRFKDTVADHGPSVVEKHPKYV